MSHLHDMTGSTGVWHAVKDEAKRTPLTLAFGAIATIGTIIGLFKSAEWAAYSPYVPPVPADAIGETAYLIFLAAILGASSGGAVMARFINAISPVSAYFASILIAVPAILASTLVARNTGVRLGPNGLVKATHDAIYYGVVLVFLAINAIPVLDAYRRFMAKVNSERKPETEEGQNEAVGDGSGLFMIAGAWMFAVFKGQQLTTFGMLGVLTP